MLAAQIDLILLTMGMGTVFFWNRLVAGQSLPSGGEGTRVPGSPLHKPHSLSKFGLKGAVGNAELLH